MFDKKKIHNHKTSNLFFYIHYIYFFTAWCSGGITATRIICMIVDNLGFGTRKDDSAQTRPVVDWDTLFESSPAVPEGMQRSKE